MLLKNKLASPRDSSQGGVADKGQAEGHPTLKPDLQHHLSRVMKLMAKREDIRNDQRGSPSTEHLAVSPLRNNTDGSSPPPHFTVGSYLPSGRLISPTSGSGGRTYLAPIHPELAPASQEQSKLGQKPRTSNKLKRSMTNISDGNIVSIPTNPDAGAAMIEASEIHSLEKRLSRLHIVKTTVHRVSKEDQQQPGDTSAEKSDRGGIASGPLSSDDLMSPMQPSAYFTQQQKRSFIVEPEKLVLAGQAKPQVARKNTPSNSNLAAGKNRNKNGWHQMMRQGVSRGEAGVQTSPPDSAQVSVRQRREGAQSTIKARTEDEVDTQNASGERPQNTPGSVGLNLQTSSGGRVAMPLAGNSVLSPKSTTSNGVVALKEVRRIQVPQPSHIKFRGSSTMVKSIKQTVEPVESDEVPRYSTNQRQRSYKMSLLKTSQEKASEKFFLARGVGGDNLFGGSRHRSQLRKRSGKNRNSPISHSQSQMVTKPFDNSQQKGLRTAMRMTQKMQAKAQSKEDNLMRQNQSPVLSSSNWQKAANEVDHNLSRSAVVSPTQSLRNQRFLNSQASTRVSHDQNATKRPIQPISQQRRRPIKNKISVTTDGTSALFIADQSRTSAKPLSGERESLQRNQIRQTSLNKTQTYFYSKAKQSDKVLETFSEAPKVNLERMIVTKRGSNIPKERAEASLLLEGSSSNHALQQHQTQDYRQSPLSGQKQQLPNHLESILSVVQQPNDAASSVGDQQVVGKMSQLDEAIQILELSRNGLQSPTMRQGGGGTVGNAQVETRLMNELTKELDTKEARVYERHGMQSQVTYDANAPKDFDLVEHPEWRKITKELKQVYLGALQSFNIEIISQNYFVRNELKKSAGSSAQIPQQSSLKENQRSTFLSGFATRISNLFAQEERLLAEAQGQLHTLLADRKKMQDEIDRMRREQLTIKDAQTCINEVVNQYFAMGFDKKLKSKRLQEVDEFINSPALSDLVNQEQHVSVDHLEYSNTLSRLQEILIAMQLPSSLSKGVAFDMEDYVFDPDFNTKLKGLFADRFKTVQYDSALKSLQMVFKDIKFLDVGTQSIEGDIDNGLIAEVAFYKKETIRLQGEVNSMRHRVSTSERTVKQATNAKAEAHVVIQALEKSIKETRSELNKNQNLVTQYKVLNSKAQQESDSLIMSFGKLKDNFERAKRNEEKTDKLLEALSHANSRKNQLITDQDGLLGQLEELATEDQKRKLIAVRQFKKKLESKNNELKKAINEYTKRSFGRAVSLDLGAPSHPNDPAFEVPPPDDGIPKTKPMVAQPKKRRAAQRIKEQRSSVYSNKVETPRGGKRGQGSNEPKNEGTSQERKKAVDKKGTSAQASASGARQKKIKTGKLATGGSDDTGEDASQDISESERDSVNLDDQTDEPMLKRTSQKSSMLSYYDDGGEGQDSDTVKRGGGSKLRTKVKLTGLTSDADSFGGASLSDEGQNSRGSAKSGKQLKMLIFDEQKRPRKGVSQNSQRPKRKLDVHSGSSYHSQNSAMSRSLSRPLRSSKKTSFQSGRSRFGAGEGGSPGLSKPPETRKSGGEHGIRTTINRRTISTPAKFNKTDSMCQTETEMFFKYIFDFLGELERQINSGELSVEDILRVGREAMADILDPRGDQNGSEGGARAWAYQSPNQKKKIVFSVNELKECLGRLRSLSARGGDIFFAGVARTMVAKSVVPQSFNFQLSVAQQASETAQAKLRDEKQLKAFIKSEMDNLQKMTVVRTAAGGGSGLATNPPSPSKAQKAQNLITQVAAPHTPLRKAAPQLDQQSALKQATRQIDNSDVFTANHKPSQVSFGSVNNSDGPE